MSGRRFQARAKRVQKLGRDGLVEQNLATGEEKRVSHRSADISFGPDRTQEQAAGHRAAQRGGGDSAAPVKKRRRQPRPIQQTAEEAAYTAQEPYTPPEVPEVQEATAPSMRMAVDAPMLAAPVSVEEPPPPPSARRKQRNRRNRKKSKQRQAAKHTPGAARSLEDQPAAKPAPLRTAGDTPMQNRPPGPVTKKRTPRMAEGNSRLKYEAEAGKKVSDSDDTQISTAKSKLKKKRIQRFAKDSTQSVTASEQRPSRLRENTGGRLQFEAAEREMPPVSDAGKVDTARRSAKKRQIMDHAAAVKPEDRQQAPSVDTVTDQVPLTGGETDTHSRDSPTQEPSAVQENPDLYHRQPVAPKFD